ncbi:MAG TPA: hypothetical protein VM533_09065 [Fimbriiglobus sp.]|jgi:hypothetical protein|nr:hypothetical protein [Fimbriiglobus sp.]
MPRSIAILPILALLLAFAPAAPVPKVSKDAMYYFPTQVGTKLVYWVELTKTEVTELVEDAEVKDGEVIVTIRRSPETSALLKQEKLSVSAKGIMRLEESGQPVRPPVWLLKLPHEPGAKWDDDARNKSTYTVGAVEEVEVPAGKFKAIPVTRHWSMLNTPVQTTDWYAPGVGLVKRVLRGGDREVTQLVLKSVTTAEEMEQAVLKLCAVFADKRLSEAVREDAIRKLIRIGPASRWAIPNLVELLEDPKTSTYLLYAAVDALTYMGPRAAPAVPTLLRLLERSAALWRDQYRAVAAHQAVGATALWLDGWDRWRKEFEQHGLPFDIWVSWTVLADQRGILRALQAIGPAAAPAVEALTRYREKVQGHPILEKQAHDALTAIDK